MATDNYLRSYGDVTRRESIVNMVEILTARETQLMNLFGKTKAIDTIHSTLLDTLKTAGSSAVSEGGDYTMGARTTPTRLTNICERVAISFAVTHTQQAIDHYHNENELTRQTNKAMMEFANDAEFDLVRSTLVSGASGIPMKMEGIIAHISKSTNTTAHSSGTVWSASIFKGLVKANIDNTGQDNLATDVYMGSYLKDKTDDFTNKTNTVNTGSNQKELVYAVDMFETGFGKLRFHFHRYVQQSDDATARVLAIKPEKHKVAYLEETYVDNELARSGPYDKKAITGVFTLETRNQDANWFASGFKKD